MPPGPYKSHDLSGEGIKLWITYILFLTTKGPGMLPQMSDQLNAGATSANKNIKDDTHHSLTHSFYKAIMRRMIKMAK